MLCGWTGNFGCKLSWCTVTVLQLQQIWPLHTGLPWKDSSVRNTMLPRQISFKAMIYPHPKGQTILHPTMGTDIWDVSTDHHHATIPTMTGAAAAVSEGTHCAPHPANAVACATWQLMDTPITTHTMTHPTGIVTSNPTHATSHSAVTQATIPQT